jgi:hypothetical protein
MISRYPSLDVSISHPDFHNIPLLGLSLFIYKMVILLRIIMRIIKNICKALTDLPVSLLQFVFYTNMFLMYLSSAYKIKFNTLFINFCCSNIYQIN